MSTIGLTKEEIVRRGQELYNQGIREQVDSGNKGRFLVIDVLTGNFEVGDSILAARDAARARNPQAALYVVRIGYPAVYRLGSAFAEPPK